VIARVLINKQPQEAFEIMSARCSQLSSIPCSSQAKPWEGYSLSGQTPREQLSVQSWERSWKQSFARYARYVRLLYILIL